MVLSPKVSHKVFLVSYYKQLVQIYTYMTITETHYISTKCLSFSQSLQMYFFPLSFFPFKHREGAMIQRSTKRIFSILLKATSTNLYLHDNH